MSAFTFTAPLITEEDERAEQEALTEEEQAAVHRDLYGITSDSSTTSSQDDTTTRHQRNDATFQRRGEEEAAASANNGGPPQDEYRRLLDCKEDTLRSSSQSVSSSERAEQLYQQERLLLLQEALTSVPANKKTAYLHALDHCPDLVDKESPPLKYLIANGYDVPAAAKHLVLYWKHRLWMFGPDRAYRPMTLLPGGAMNDHAQYLRKALCLHLHEDDKHGRPVYYWDRIQCTRAVAPSDAVARCLFYMGHTISQDGEKACRKGYVMLLNMQGYDIYKHFDRILSKKARACIAAFPASIKAMHLFTGSGKSVMELVLPIFKQIAGKEIRLRMRLHAGTEAKSRVIHDYGLVEAHTNVVFGGQTANTSLAAAWLDRRFAIERVEYAANNDDNDNPHERLVA